MGSVCGERGVDWRDEGVVREGPGMEMPAGGARDCNGVDSGAGGAGELLGVVESGIVVAGVAGFGSEILAGLAEGVDGGGMRVTGVRIGAPLGFGRGTGLRFPDGGGIRVTGVASNLGGIGAGTGARGLLLGTGGIGAD